MLFSIKYVHRLKWNGLYQSLMWSCFGIMFMLLYPVSPELMTFIGGIMLLFQGIPQLILFLEEDERFLISLLSLVECLLVSFLGVWMLTNPEEVYDTLPAVLAFVTFLHAFSNLIITGRIRHLQYPKWWIAALVTAAKMGATAALAVQFHLHSEFMVVGTGICMLLDAVSDIWMWKKLEILIIQDMGI